MGALAPLGKVAGAKKQWLKEVTAYTLAGMASSAFIGTILGWLGELLVPQWIANLGIPIAITVAVIGLARELGLISFPLPQFKRQTRDIWAKIFPGTVAAALWGLDLGLIFTTYFTFVGIWLIFVVAILTREPAFGAALFVAYWLGRVLSVWVAPMIMPDAGSTPRFLDAIDGQYKLFQRLHAVGLGWSIIVLTLWLTENPIIFR